MSTKGSPDNEAASSRMASYDKSTLTPTLREEGTRLGIRKQDLEDHGGRRGAWGGGDRLCEKIM